MRHPRAALFTLLVLPACPKPVAEVAAPPIPDDAPRHDPNGPVAGPLAVIEGGTPPPPEDTPGWGPLHPYIAKVRQPVTEGMLACMKKAPAVVTEGPALLAATIGSDGELRQVTLSRSSGAEALDDCLLQAFRQAAFPAPPAELLGEDGAVGFQIAFR